MTRPPLVKDFPLSETRPDEFIGPRGRRLADITAEAITAGTIAIEDLSITPEALLAQAAIARDAGRAALAANFTRAADLVGIPNDVIMATYDLLRPGRTTSRAALEERARMLRHEYGADVIAAFIEEAAREYQRRGLVTK